MMSRYAAEFDLIGNGIFEIARVGDDRAEVEAVYNECAVRFHASRMVELVERDVSPREGLDWTVCEKRVILQTALDRPKICG